jgi:predicted kinase
MWQKAERENFRQRAGALGAQTIIHFLDVPVKQLLERLNARNQQASDDVTYSTIAMMKGYLPDFQAPDADELARYSD